MIVALGGHEKGSTAGMKKQLYYNVREISSRAVSGSSEERITGSSLNRA